jgi:hypothetical protein
MISAPPIPYTLCGHDDGKNSFVDLSRGDEHVQRFEGDLLDSLYPKAVEERDRLNKEHGVCENLRLYWERFGPGGTWETRPAPPADVWQRG